MALEFRPGRCPVVAEIAQTHDGSLGTAHAYVDAVARAGAAAIKFQTHIAAAESTPHEPWRVRFSRQDDSRYAYWARMEFTRSQWAGLVEHCGEAGVAFVTSPFSLAAFDLLDGLDVDAWKIASGEVGNGPLIEAAAATGRPVVLSSGLSPLAELDEAVARVRAAGTEPVVLQCTTAYPCPPERIGLNQIAALRDRLRCPVGLSDHSGTIWPAIAAATLGAAMIELHVTMSREAFGPDVVASVTTTELAQLVDGIGWVETMAAHPVDKDAEAAGAADLRALFTRSVVAARDLPAGHVLVPGDLVAKKPGTGIPADRIDQLIGRRTNTPVVSDQLLTEADLDP